MKTIDKMRGRRRIYFVIAILVVALLSYQIYEKNKDVKLDQNTEHAVLESIQAPVSVPVVEIVQEPTPVIETPVQVPEIAQKAVEVPEPVAVAPVVNNESIAWDYLINKGYSRIAVAGVMGNLMQEHRFQTSDEPNGLGIAQWTGGRRLLLMTRPNYLDINVQLDYLNYELDTVQSTTRNGLHNATSVEEAVRVFQNDFERCGDCRENQRVQYAYEILARH